jgi:glycerol-3-phosphate dehydrogenase
LVSVYGARAAGVVEIARGRPATARLVDEGLGIVAAEIVHALEREFARTLTDVLMRRTMAGLEPEVDRASVEAVASVMAEHEGWDGERTGQEVEAYLALAARARPNSRFPAPAETAEAVVTAG